MGESVEYLGPTVRVPIGAHGEGFRGAGLSYDRPNRGVVLGVRAQSADQIAYLVRWADGTESVEPVRYLRRAL
jgi:hypothetical protein